MDSLLADIKSYLSSIDSKVFCVICIYYFVLKFNNHSSTVYQ